MIMNRYGESTSAQSVFKDFTDKSSKGVHYSNVLTGNNSNEQLVIIFDFLNVRYVLFVY